MRTFLIIIAIVIVGVLIWGFSTHWGQGKAASTSASASPSPVSGQANISIENFSFNPNSLAITTGTKVTWTNNDSTTHTVTSDSNAFSSGQLQPGSSFDFTFNTPGTFSYHCSIHTSMTGTIEVQ